MSTTEQSAFVAAATGSIDFSSPASTKSSHLGRLKIHDDLVLAVKNHQTLDSFLRQLAVVVSEHSEVVALWISKRSQQGEFSQIHAISDQDTGAIWSIVEEPCRDLFRVTGQSDTITFREVTHHENHQLVAVPVSHASQTEYVLAGCFATGNQTPVRQHWLMSMVGQAFARWLQQRQLEEASVKAKSLNDALSLIQTLDQTTDVQQACLVIANHLRRLCE